MTPQPEMKQIFLWLLLCLTVLAVFHSEGVHIELNSSVIIVGESDYLIVNGTSRCIETVDRALLGR